MKFSAQWSMETLDVPAACWWASTPAPDILGQCGRPFASVWMLWNIQQRKIVRVCARVCMCVCLYLSCSLACITTKSQVWLIFLCNRLYLSLKQKAKGRKRNHDGKVHYSWCTLSHLFIFHQFSLFSYVLFSQKNSWWDIRRTANETGLSSCIN